MATYRIAVLPGDGIGPEVIEEGLKILRALQPVRGVEFDCTEFNWGSTYYMKHGRMMPTDALDRLLAFDAIYFGAVGHPEIQDHITLNGLLLPMRRAFDQYVCLRPSVLHTGVESPLRNKNPGEIDMVVIRENVEGEYANVGGFQYSQMPQEVALHTAVFTRQGCERIIRFAFELSRKRNHKKSVSSITKSNAMGYGMVLWDDVFTSIAREYPDIATESLLVDAACMDFIRRPESFDVVVASNLFGDILTDIGAIITGSMGLAPSGNINPEKRYPSLFEPVHGSATDIAGTGVANPMAATLSLSMLLEHLGEQKAADDVESATLTVLADRKFRTADLAGSSTTCEVGDAIVAALLNLY